MARDRRSAADPVGELYRAHRATFLRLASFLVSDPGLAEEIVQDAFTNLHRNWSRLANPDAALAYLRSSVVNLARNTYRRRAVARRNVALVAEQPEPGADFAFLLAEEHREVVLALRRLPARQREVLVLRYWAELSEAEIAAAIGISRGTVKSSASRALDALEAMLKELR